MIPKKLKRNLIVSVILFTIAMGNMIRMHSLDNIRAVDALQISACGMIFGIILVNVFMFINFKEKG